MSFSPDVFFDISGYLENKKEAMGRYKSELRDYPHPRSIEGPEVLAKYRGIQVGLEYIEVFKLVRMIR